MPTCENKALFGNFCQKKENEVVSGTKIKDNKEHVLNQALATTNVNCYFGQVFLQREVREVSAYSLFYKIKVWKLKTK